MQLTRLLLLVSFLITVLSISVAAEENDCLYYFYGQDCASCSTVSTYLDQLQLKYPLLQIQKYEVYYDKTNYLLLQQYFAAHDVSALSQGVPAVFLPGSYFVGGEPVLSLLEDRIQTNTDASCPSLQQANAVGVVGEKSPENVLDTLTFTRVTGAGFSEVAQPAMWVVLLLFLFLLVVVPRHDIIILGLLFAAGAYVGLFLLGMGLFDWFIAHPDSVSFAVKIAALLGAIVGAWGLKKFFWGGFKENFAARLVWLFTYQGIVLLGFIASFLLFGSMSSVFLSLRVLVSDAATRWMVVPLLLYYVLMAVAAMVALTLLYYYLQVYFQQVEDEKGKYSKDKRERWRKYHVRKVNLVLSILAVVVGIFILFG